MNIFSAMQSGVSGLFSQANKLSRIADNIANVNTTGYKKSFVDFVSVTTGASSANSAAMPSSSVRAVVRQTVDKQGTVITTNVPTDLAVSGKGYFVVGKQNDTSLASNFFLTRSGSFRVNEEGYMVNSAGYYLEGFKFQDDGTLGSLDRTSFSSLVPVQVGDISQTGSPTSEMTYTGNLPAQQTGLLTAPAPFVTTSEYFTSLGASGRLQFSWQASTTPNAWTLTVSDDTGVTYGSVDVAFNDSGANAGSPAAYSGVTNSATVPAAFAFDTATGKATVTIANGATPQTITIDFGAPGTFKNVTQFAGDYSSQVEKDGATSGTLSRVEFSEDGILYGVFDNGVRKALYQVPLGDVTNPAGLQPTDGNAYVITSAAGTFSMKDPNSGAMGYLASGSLERSNVDLAEELTSMIETQRAYSSNAKVVQTADEMLNETTNLKR